MVQLRETLNRGKFTCESCRSLMSSIEAKAGGEEIETRRSLARVDIYGD